MVDPFKLSCELLVNTTIMVSIYFAEILEDVWGMWHI